MKRMVYGVISRYMIGHHMDLTHLGILQYMKNKQNQLRG